MEIERRLCIVRDDVERLVRVSKFLEEKHGMSSDGMSSDEVQT